METKIIYRYPLGNPRRKYRQDNLVISTFKAYTGNIRLGIEHCKEMGFNMVEFGWVPPAESMKCMVACEEVGIDGLFQNWDAFGGMSENHGRKDVDMKALLAYLEETRKYRHMAGHYVWDEPLTKETMEVARQQTDLVEQLDPERLIYDVALPGDNSYGRNWECDCYEEYLTEYLDIVDPVVASLDNYPFKPWFPEPADQLDSVCFCMDLALLRKLALERDMPMWFYFQSIDNPWKHIYQRLTPEQLRVQQYQVLLHGAKGLHNYNVEPGAIRKEDGTKGPLFYATKELNYCCRQLGKTLMALTSVGVYQSAELLKGNKHFDKLRMSIKDSKVLADQELPFRCSVGEFVDSEGNRYLMIQNRDYKTTSQFTFELQKAFWVYEVSKDDGMQRIRNESVNKLGLLLQPGDAVLLRFQDAAEEAYTIDYVLKK